MVRLFNAALFVLAATPLVLAQVGATAQLAGEVTDLSGRVLSNQILTVRNLESGQTRTVQTSADGRYEALDLAPGRYEVTAAIPGFAPIRVPVELTINQQAVLNLQFQVASQRQEVTVTATPQLIEPTRTELSQVIDERQIDNLPINGRQFLDFVLLTPNVTTWPHQCLESFFTRRAGPGGSLVRGSARIHFDDPGGRRQQHESRIRALAFDPLGGGRAGISRLKRQLRAELRTGHWRRGRIITKSGTNDLHGSSYEYFRNNAMDARNILAPAGFDELRQNQFGATLGGKLVADRLFYFINYEGQRREESPSYSSILLNNLTAINRAKQSLGLPPEVLAGVLRDTNYDEGLGRLDYAATATTQMSLEYRFRQDRDTNVPAAIGQLSAPSNFRDANIDDHDARVEHHVHAQSSPRKPGIGPVRASVL